MRSRSYGWALLGVLAMPAIPACSCTEKCGVQPPHFAISSGGFWDPNKPRPSLSEVSDYCSTLYSPAENEIRKSGTKINIPSIDVTAGKVGLSGGGVDIGTERTTKYVQLQGLDLAMVQAQKARCSANQQSYNCVVFSDAKENPEMKNADQFFAAIHAAQQVKKAAEHYETATTPAAREAAATELKQAIDAAPPVPAAPISGIERGWDSDVRGLDDRLVTHAGMIDAAQKKADNASREIAMLRSNLDRLSQQTAAMDALIMGAATGQAHLAACQAAWKKENRDVRALRERMNMALAGSATFSVDALREPIVLNIGGAGFAPCKDTLSDGMRTKAAKVGEALAVLLREHPSDPVGVVVEGFSDQQPIDRDGVDRDECKKHKFRNDVLAEDRAKSVGKVISTVLAQNQVASEPAVVTIGHDDRFLQNCRELTGQAASDCHAVNRRFVITLTGAAMTLRVPDECLTAPQQASPTPAYQTRAGNP